MRAIAETRDQKLLDGVQRHKYMRADQAAELYFQNIRNPEQRKRKAAARLLALHKRQLLKRFRVPGDPFIYTTTGNKYSTKMIHYLAIIDVFLEIKSLLPTSTVIDYEIESKEGNCITDLIIHYRNDFRRQSGDLYIEVELESSGNVIQKVKKYEELLEDRENTKLVVVCKHSRTVQKIQQEEFEIQVKAIPIQAIKERWE